MQRAHEAGLLCSQPEVKYELVGKHISSTMESIMQELVSQADIAEMGFSDAMRLAYRPPSSKSKASVRQV